MEVLPGQRDAVRRHGRDAPPLPDPPRRRAGAEEGEVVTLGPGQRHAEEMVAHGDRCSDDRSVAHDGHRVPSVSGRSASRCRPDRVGRDPVGNRRRDGCARRSPSRSASSHSGPPSGPLASRTGYRASSPDGPALCGLLAWRGASPSRIGPMLVAASIVWFIPDFSTCLNVEPLAHRCLRVDAFAWPQPVLGWARLAILGAAIMTYASGRADGAGRRMAVIAIVISALSSSLIPTVAAVATPLLLVAAPLLLLTDDEGPGGPEALAAPIAGVTLAVGLVAERDVAIGLDAAVILTSVVLLLGVTTVARRAETITADRAVGLGPALATALGDPTFQVAIPVPGSPTWVDTTGRPIEASATRDPAGAEATAIEREGILVARITHDPEPSPTRRFVRPSRPRSSCPRITSVCARTSRLSWPSWRRPAGAWSTPVCVRARRWVDRSTATCSSGSPSWSDAWRRSADGAARWRCRKRRPRDRRARGCTRRDPRPRAGTGASVAGRGRPRRCPSRSRRPVIGGGGSRRSSGRHRRSRA